MAVVQPVFETVTLIYIYLITVGKSMPIDNYEQYKRVINQITLRERERIRTYYARIQISGKYLVFQSVLANLHVHVCNI